MQGCPPSTLDLAVVGAGPHALALVTRLLSQYPSSQFSDSDHSRLSQPKTVKAVATEGGPRPQRSVRVIDDHGWMGKWNQWFEGLSIRHLRSTALFHPDASDDHALLAFAASTGRQKELEEIPGLLEGSLKRRGNRIKGYVKESFWVF
jgi:hypothetical protein